MMTENEMMKSTKVVIPLTALTVCVSIVGTTANF
jgi:hypothetical protein